MLKIVTDGSADMPAGWEELYDVHTLPINIHFGSQQFLQGVNIHLEDFYRMVYEQRMIPKTSLPSPRQIAEFYGNLAQKGETILSIHVASKMSGTFAAAQIAAKEILGTYQIVPFDSGSGSAVLAFMTKEARELDRQGASLQEILNRLEYIRRKVTVIFTLDTLEFARLSGRVSALQATISSMLQIKPIILLRDGLLDMADKVRTRSRSLDRMLEMVGQRMGNQQVNMAVVHAFDPLTGETIMDQVRKMFNIKELIMTELSIAVAANLGPHTIGIVAYPVNETDEG